MTEQNNYRMQNGTAVHCSDSIFNRIRQVAPTVQKRANIILGSILQM